MIHPRMFSPALSCLLIIGAGVAQADDLVYTKDPAQQREAAIPLSVGPDEQLIVAALISCPGNSPAEIDPSWFSVDWSADLTVDNASSADPHFPITTSATPTQWGHLIEAQAFNNSPDRATLMAAFTIPKSHLVGLPLQPR